MVRGSSGRLPKDAYRVFKEIMRGCGRRVRQEKILSDGFVTFISSSRFDKTGIRGQGGAVESSVEVALERKEELANSVDRFIMHVINTELDEAVSDCGNTDAPNIRKALFYNALDGHKYPYRVFNDLGISGREFYRRRNAFASGVLTGLNLIDEFTGEV